MKAISLSLLLALSCTSCSRFTAQGRSERAYSKYVRKTSMARYKQRSRFFNGKMRMPLAPPPSSEPVQSVETGPVSATTGS